MKECPACHRCFQDQVNHCPSDGERLKFLIPLDTVLDERYLLERKLGQGGMGLVFKAHHKFIKTQHAIKVILPDLVGNDPSLTARFRQEAMAAAAIRHPNTVSVTDYGILNDTTPYLVMEDAVVCDADGVGVAYGGGGHRLLDRKSTRLNSSHSQ